MPVTNVKANWTGGSLQFQKKSDATELMTIATTGVNIPTLTSDTVSTAAQEVTIQSGIIDTTYDTDRFIWTCPFEFGCTVTSITFMQSVIENTSATSTCMIEKVPSGTAIGSGVDLLAAPLNLKTGVTANTVASPALHATPANLTLAQGDSLGLDFTNALTEYVGCCTITATKLYA
jgi:hypothetical protein